MRRGSVGRVFTPCSFRNSFGRATQLGFWLRSGKLIALETVIDGFENAPRSLAGLFRGENLGKMLLHVARINPARYTCGDGHEARRDVAREAIRYT